MQSPNSRAINSWHARIRQISDPVALQVEMDSLGAQYSRLTAYVHHKRSAFVPANPNPITYLASTFLLALDWWHVLGDMWFLWLAGFVLEDTGADHSTSSSTYGGRDGVPVRCLGESRKHRPLSGGRREP